MFMIKDKTDLPNIYLTSYERYELLKFRFN